MNIEKTILQNLIFNEEFARRALPHLKLEYFHSREDSILFSIIREYIDKYNQFQTKESLFVDLSKQEDLSDDQYSNIQEKINELNNEKTDVKWLIDTTEAFCQEKAVYNCIRESIDIIDGKSKHDKGVIPKLMQDALSVSFDARIGHDYMNEWEDRFNAYHAEQVRVPFDIDYLNKITKNGFPRKTFNLLVAGCVEEHTKVKVRIRKKS